MAASAKKSAKSGTKSVKAAPKSARSGPKSSKPAPASARSLAKKKAAGGDAIGDWDVSAGAKLAHDLPPLSDVQREAFRSRFTDAQCDAWGTRTKAVAVLSESTDWCGKIHRALRAFPHALGNYGEARLGWLLECVKAMHEELVAQKVQNSGVAPEAAALDRALAAGNDVRARLLETLAVLVGGRDDEQAILQGAAGHAPVDPATLADSLSSLAELAAGWLARADAVNRALVASTNLAPSRVDEARAAARAIRAAVGTRTLGGPVAARDSVAVNRAEGRVLREMHVAMRVFDAAHAREKLIPRLVPGAGTRHVLAHPSGAHAKPADAAASAPAPTSGTLPAAR